MRELKFRAWYYHQNKFQYGGLEMFRDFSFPLNWCEIQQFTGLKDNKVKEIYEGDILKCPKGYHFEVFWLDADSSFELAYLDCDKTPDDYAPVFNWRFALTSEIIGNKYEKPKI